MSDRRLFLLGIAVMVMGMGIAGGWDGTVIGSLSFDEIGGFVEGVGFVVALASHRLVEQR